MFSKSFLVFRRSSLGLQKILFFNYTFWKAPVKKPPSSWWLRLLQKLHLLYIVNVLRREKKWSSHLQKVFQLFKVSANVFLIEEEHICCGLKTAITSLQCLVSHLLAAPPDVQMWKILQSWSYSISLILHKRLNNT